MSDRAGDFLDKIVKPIITDTSCQSLIMQNKDFYITLINTGGDEAYELKNSLKNIAKHNADEQLIEFVNAITKNDEIIDSE